MQAPTSVDVLCTSLVPGTEEAASGTLLYVDGPVLVALDVPGSPRLASQGMVPLLEPHTAGKPGHTGGAVGVTNHTLVPGILTWRS